MRIHSFQLLRTLIDITNAIDLVEKGSGTETRGKDVFPVFLRRIKNEFEHPAQPSAAEDVRAIDAYEIFYSKHNTELGHYFRFIYNILKYIDTSGIDNKTFYSNLLRAQLFDAEVAILYFNSVAKFGVQKMKPLVERYAMLKTLDEKIAITNSLRSRYAQSAFGNSTANSNL